MVEYICKNQRYYKLLKNGDKKRISQDEYNKKNKSMKGGQSCTTFEKSGPNVLDDFRKFSNIDLYDTLNEPCLNGILDNTLDQRTINKILLTAIKAGYNRAL